MKTVEELIKELKEQVGDFEPVIVTSDKYRALTVRPKDVRDHETEMLFLSYMVVRVKLNYSKMSVVRIRKRLNQPTKKIYIYIYIEQDMKAVLESADISEYF